MKVWNILQKKGNQVYAIDPGANLLEASRVLYEKNVGALLVLDSNKSVVGIISERDIVRGIAKFDETDKPALNVLVATVMTRRVITCDLNDTVTEVMTKMSGGRFRHLPVLDTDRQLVGIVSMGDAVKCHIEALTGEIDELKAYIRNG
jgi:CBS domain-containing protein